MCFNNVKMMNHYFVFLVLLKLILNVKVYAIVDAKSLVVICGLQNGIDIIKKPPPGCTALAATTYNPDHVAKINLIKGPLPLMLVDDSITFNDWTSIVKDDPSKYFDNQVLKNVDIIAFDNMYNEHATSLDQTFSKNLLSFIQKAKAKHPGMLFGIAVPSDSYMIKNNLNLQILTKELDFILLKYRVHNECTVQTHQASMETMQTTENIAYMIEQVTEAGMDKNKIIFTISLNIRSMIKGSDEPTDMSYSELCSEKKSIKRKYCVQSVQDLFDKGRYRIDQSLAGIYIQDCENDDTQGYCECTLQSDQSVINPGLRIIVGASTDKDHSVDYYQCSSGNFPKIL